MRWTLGRRRFLRSMIGGAFAGMIAVPGYARFLEPGWFEVTHKGVPIGRRRLRRGVRILHLSDLHASEFVPYSQIAEAIELGLAERPDFACLTGDYVTHRMPEEGDFSGALRPLAEAVPTLAVFGNHDGGRWVGRHGGYQDISTMRSALEAAGVRCLHNESCLVEVGGQPIRFTGVGDLWAREIDAATAFASVGAGASEPHVLLAHNPDSRFDVADRPWDLMLSGHTHGGQVIVPVVGYAPFVGVSDPRFLEGLQPWNGRLVHITRGVGNLLGWRLACRPEVSLLTLEPTG